MAVTLVSLLPEKFPTMTIFVFRQSLLDCFTYIARSTCFVCYSSIQIINKVFLVFVRFQCSYRICCGKEASDNRFKGCKKGAGDAEIEFCFWL